MSNSGKGYAFVITSSFLTGCIYTLGKVALAVISPALLIAWIFSIAAVILAVWSLASGQWRDILRCTARDWYLILAFSLFSIGALQTMWMGVQHLDPTVASFIGRLQTLVAVFLGVLFLKERFQALEAFGGLVLIIGVAIIRISFDVTLSIWFWVMVSSGVLFGITEIFAKQIVGRLHPVPLNLVRNTIIAVVFVVWISWRKDVSLLGIGKTWPYLVAIGVGGPLLSRLSFLFALRHIEVSKAVLINQMQPLWVYAIAFTMLGLMPSLREWIGGLLILAGCVALMGGRRDKIAV